MSEEPIDGPLNDALRRWRVEGPRDLWPEIEARLDRLDDPLGAILEGLRSLKIDVAALRSENRALRAEVSALRRTVAGSPRTARLPEPDWIGRDRK